MKAQASVMAWKPRNQNRNLQEGLGTSLFGEIMPRASVDPNPAQGLHGLPSLEDAL